MAQGITAQGIAALAAAMGASASASAGPTINSNSGNEDQLRIEMLGAGQEVGRSCCVLSYKGKTVVCDAGVHPAFTGIAALPFIDDLDWSTVDALLITHFHLDHAAALTYVMEKTNFKDGKGKVYMTHPTKAVYRILMSDFVRVSSAGSEDQLFDENEMLASWKEIEAVDYHQEVIVTGGLRFTPYHAGHVLGACMFFIEIAGLKILYTGDYSREEDRHLVQAEIPPVKPDVLICESTYGVQSHDSRLEKEQRFTTLIHNIIRRGGRVLLPVFVLGRAQELLLLLDEYWSAHPDLHSIPVYYASGMARKAISIYQTYIHTMNDHVRSRFNKRDNPFVFKHISNLKNLDKFEDKGPCVMMASPGFMQSGVSRELLERWAPDSRNGLIVSGYSVEGTMARHILTDPDEIIAQNGQKIQRRMSVDYMSFSAHVDYTQNSKFIDEVKPSHIVLVHGERTNMNRLRAALQSKYSDKEQDIKVYTPKNCDPLFISFRGERTAKAIGAIAEKYKRQDDENDSDPKSQTKTISKTDHRDSLFSGLLVSKDFAFTILDPKDLTDFTGLSTTEIIQRQRINLGVSWELARWHLEGMYGKVVEGVDLEGMRTMRIMDVLDIKQIQESKTVLSLEWMAGNQNDMIADSAVALLLGIDSSPATIKLTTKPHSHGHAHGHEDEGEDEHGGEIETEENLESSRLEPKEPHPYAQASTSSFTCDPQAAIQAVNSAKMEHFSDLLEAQFGNVEEIIIGKSPEEQNKERKSQGEQTSTASTGPNQENPDAKMEDAQGDSEMKDAAEGAKREEKGKSEEEEDGDELLRAIKGPQRQALRVWLDDQPAILDMSSMRVHSRSSALRSRIEKLANLGTKTFTPLAEAFTFQNPLPSSLFLGKHGHHVEAGSGAADEDQTMIEA